MEVEGVEVKIQQKKTSIVCSVWALGAHVGRGADVGASKGRPLFHHTNHK